MGSWGYRPRDNDGAMDMLSLVEDAAGIATLSLYRGGYAVEEGDFGDGQRWARLGVVQSLLDARFGLPKAVVGIAKTDCEHLLKTGSYFKSFTDPSRARRETRKLLKKLEETGPASPFGIMRAIEKGKGPTIKSLASKGGRRKPRGKAKKTSAKKHTAQKRTRSR